MREFGDLVKDAVEENLNKMLDAEEDELFNTVLHERTKIRIDTRAATTDAS